MSRPRLVLIARRFWPLVGGAEVMLTRLAMAAAAGGTKVTVVTAHWQADWPREFDHGGVRVVRLPPPGRTIWGQMRYLRSIAVWLRRHREEFDLALAGGMRHEAYAVLRAARRGRFPVVLRAEGFGLHGDCHWQLEARCGARIKRQCYRAAALVAPCRSIERELIAAGYSRDRIHIIADGVPIPSVSEPGEQLEARLALAESEPSLAIGGDDRVAVYIGRLAPGKGLDVLLGAWRLVTNHRPHARLWLVGDGPERERLTHQIRNLGLVGRVTLAGAYDDVDDFWRAADLFVLPGAEATASLALREAMAWGLPIVAIDTEENRSLLADGQQGRLVPKSDTATLAAAVGELLDNPSIAAQLGQNARTRAAVELPLVGTVERYVRLCQSVCDTGRNVG